MKKGKAGTPVSKREPRASEAAPSVVKAVRAAVEATESVDNHHVEALNTMSNTAAEINSFVEAGKKMVAPMTKMTEVSTRAFERIAKYQYEVAGDYLHYGIAQLHAAAQGKDMPALLQKQAELANSYFEKQTQRSQEFLKIASETQADVMQAIDRASSEFAARAKAAA
ncbi:MAG: phasin family protein [Pseudomonadota bacterium]|jgi:phasin family protein